MGIILNQDARDAIAFQLPDHAHTLRCRQREAIALQPRTALEFRRDGEKLAVVVNEQAVLVTNEPVIVAPRAGADDSSRLPLTPGSGILVRGVPAGRGFHWQKQVDQTYAGGLEVSLGRGSLVIVNEVPLEAYLAGVITAEMSGACPAEFLKAQCVVARSWLLANSEHKHTGDPFDRCNDDCCQRYQGTGQLTEAALGATRATRGRVLLTSTASVLDANYSKCCGGISEEPRFVWGADKPGISAVVDAPGDAAERAFFPINGDNIDEYVSGVWLRGSHAYCGPATVPPGELARYLGHVDVAGDYFRWTVCYARAELEDVLRTKLPATNLAQLVDLRILARGVSGRVCGLAVEWIHADGQRRRTALSSEYRIRECLHPKFLYSSAIVIDMQRDAGGAVERVTLRGVGWGHGVGMCQIGALGMALTGIDHEAICRHYFPQATWGSAYA